MIRTEPHKIPAQTIDRVTAYICDMCGAETENDDNWESGSDYDVHATRVWMKHGYSAPDSGSIETTRFDICTKCFSDKLIPWLKEHGASPRKITNEH